MWVEPGREFQAEETMGTEEGRWAAQREERPSLPGQWVGNSPPQRGPHPTHTSHFLDLTNPYDTHLSPSSNEHLLSTYYMPGPVLGTGTQPGSRQIRVCFHGLCRGV